MHCFKRTVLVLMSLSLIGTAMVLWKDPMMSYYIIINSNNNNINNSHHEMNYLSSSSSLSSSTIVVKEELQQQQQQLCQPQPPPLIVTTTQAQSDRRRRWNSNNNKKNESFVNTDDDDDTNKRTKTPRLDNVVLVGHFNFPPTSIKFVVHWVQRWSDVFDHIHVRGPFDERTMAKLKRNGIVAFVAAADEGYYSPMTTLAETLRYFSHDADYNNDTTITSTTNSTIRGVIMAHDDLLFNVSLLVEQGFPFDDTIVMEGTISNSALNHHDNNDKITTTTTTTSTTTTLIKKNYTGHHLEHPYMTVYGNNTFSLWQEQHDNNIIPPSLYSIDDFENHTFPWRWWDWLLPRAVNASIAAAAAKELEHTPSHPYIGNDGGLTLYHEQQSDFLYVPMKYAHAFAAHADWMVQHEIFLEMAMPTIVGTLLHQFPNKLSVLASPLCSGWTKKRKFALPFLHKCFRDWGNSHNNDNGNGNDNGGDGGEEYGIYHPVKLQVLGMGLWDVAFDMIVHGPAHEAAKTLAKVRYSFKGKEN